MRFLLLLIALSPAALARIGETPAQCGKRYGLAHTSEDRAYGERRVYSRGGVEVVCWFRENRCSSIEFSLIAANRISSEGEGPAPRFSDAQALRLIEVNNGGAKWEKTAAEKSPVYVSSDKKLWAKISPTWVCIQTAEDIEARKALTKPEFIDKTIETFEGLGL